MDLSGDSLDQTQTKFYCKIGHFLHPFSILASSCTQGRGGLPEPIPAVTGQKQCHTLDKQFFAGPHRKTYNHSHSHTYRQFRVDCGRKLVNPCRRRENRKAPDPGSNTQSSDEVTTGPLCCQGPYAFITK